MTQHFPFTANGQPLTATVYRAHEPLAITLLLGPGMDGSQRNPFVVAQASELAARGVLVVTHDFPFAVRGASAPDAMTVLTGCARAAIVAAGQCRPTNRLFVGGKSLSARVLSLVLADGAEESAGVLGLVALGYPLHPVGRPDERKESHLLRLPVPAFFVQGTRDVLGTSDQLRDFAAPLPPGTEVYPVDGGDHELVVPTRGSMTQSESNETMQDAVVRWMQLVAAPTVRPPGPRGGRPLASPSRG